MNGMFGDYTSINKKRIEAIVKKVNDRSLECRNITTDQTKKTINYRGIPIIGTKEQEEFVKKTEEFRKRLREGETIDDIMVEALAVVREAIRRKTKMYPYDTQIEAAVSMLGVAYDKEHRERVIAEMKTGEGKTLVQMLVAYLNVLEATKDEDKSKWSSVHIITSNDALAKRDQKANQAVFELLGITSGFVPGRSATRTNDPAQRMINKKKKQLAYVSDVVYATATTIAFDYLEDHTIYRREDRNINRRMGYAIVDEADDILIDQATNPLKLSQVPNPDSSVYERLLIERQNERRAIYKWATEFLYGKIRKKPMSCKLYDQYFENRYESFKEEYAYVKDTRQIILSKRIEEEIGADLPKNDEGTAIYNARYFALLDCIRAKEAFHADVEYRVEVKDGKAKIIIIDQNIGRKKYSSKYTGGMQEAVEAKEEFLENESLSGRKRYHVEFSNNSVIKAICTYPDFLSVYEHNVCGMTGTSDEEEFRQLYGFETYRVRTRKRNIRIDEEPELYATLNEKYAAILEEVKKCVSTGQPVLIGTTSLMESEVISALLAKNNIRHQVLNANNEEKENQIVAGAGMMGTITVSTNMAGRGTDIKLGPGVRELGGLLVISTSRNKSSRIDRQLMGRSGRQGDPGRTKQFSSLEDDLVREHYKGGALDGVIKMFRGTNKPIRNKKIIEAARRSQQARESRDKQSRLDSEKYNLSFMKQRRIIYENRTKVLDSNILDFMKMIKGIIVKYAEILVKNYKKEDINRLIGHLVPVNSLYNNNPEIFKENIINAIYDKFKANFDTKKVKNKDIEEYVKNIKRKFLDIIDVYWLTHIEYLEALKLNIAFSMRGNDPFKEYEVQSTRMFSTELIPAMYNEMLTYALNPSMKYGEYMMENVEPTESLPML